MGCIPAFSQPASTPGPLQDDLLEANHAVSDRDGLTRRCFAIEGQLGFALPLPWWRLQIPWSVCMNLENALNATFRPYRTTMGEEARE
jgi:hypothetical protein